MELKCIIRMIVGLIKSVYQKLTAKSKLTSTVASVKSKYASLCEKIDACLTPTVAMSERKLGPVYQEILNILNKRHY